jgi:hypothetical protein
MFYERESERGRLLQVVPVRVSKFFSGSHGKNVGWLSDAACYMMRATPRRYSVSVLDAGADARGAH